MQQNSTCICPHLSVDSFKYIHSTHTLGLSWTCAFVKRIQIASSHVYVSLISQRRLTRSKTHLICERSTKYQQVQGSSFHEIYLDVGFFWPNRLPLSDGPAVSITSTFGIKAILGFFSCVTFGIIKLMETLEYDNFAKEMANRQRNSGEDPSPPCDTWFGLVWCFRNHRLSPYLSFRRTAGRPKTPSKGPGMQATATQQETHKLLEQSLLKF